MKMDLRLDACMILAGILRRLGFASLAAVVAYKAVDAALKRAERLHHA